MSAEYVDMEIEVMVDIDEALAPADLFTRTTTDEWRDALYDLPTRESVLEHWAFNAIHNGVRDVSRLEGWGDVADDAVRLRVRP